MRRRRCRLLLLGSALAAGGCVLPDQLSQIQKDVTAVQQQLRQVQREQDEARETLARLAARPENDEAPTREELADVSLRVDRTAREVAVVGERVNDLNARVDQLSQDISRALARGGGGAVPPAGGSSGAASYGEPLEPAGDRGGAASGPGPGAIPDPEALYNTAYADFSKGNYELSIAGFEEYQERFPESALADNALYWIGECHFSQGNFRASVEAFDRLLSRYPKSDKAAAADLKKALAFLEQNQLKEGIVQLRYVASRYPRTDEAQIAGDKLSSLGQPLD
jgi:tol-pal system protein YbgF